MRSFVFICWMLIHSADVVSAANWYVDNAASGSRNGTSWANAWTNLANVTGISAGDTVYISGGTTTKTYQPWGGGFYEWVPASTGGNGTAGNPITYRIGQDAGHNGIIIIDGTGLASPSGRLKTEGWRHGVISGNYNNDGVNHMVFTNTAAHLGDSSWGIRIENVSYYEGMRFLNCTNMQVVRLLLNPPALVSVALQWSVYPLAAELSAFTNNLIEQCRFVLPISSNTPAWGTDGIFGGYCTDANSNIFTTYFVTNNTEWQHGDGWQNLGGSWCRVRNSSFENIGSYPVYWECISSVTSISNVHFYNNLFTFTNGYIHTNSSSVAITIGPQGASGQTYSNIVVANNTVVDHWRFSPLVIGQTTTTNTWLNSVFANNLLINSRACTILNRTNGSSYDNVTNGIFFAYNKAVALTDGNTTMTPAQMVSAGGDANLAVTTYARLAAGNNLRLLSTDTAALNFGYDSSSLFTTDSDGNTRSGTWDLGAYEYIAPSTTHRGFQFGSGVQLIGATIRQ